MKWLRLAPFVVGFMVFRGLEGGWGFFSAMLAGAVAAGVVGTLVRLYFQLDQVDKDSKPKS